MAGSSCHKTALALLVLLLAGCSVPQYKRPDYSRYIWPPAPERPRVKLLRIIQTDLDIRGRSHLEAIFGEELTWVLGKPHGVAVDRQGNVYVTDTWRQDVSILNLQEGTVSLLFNPHGWHLPMGVAVDDENGLLAVVDGRRLYIFGLGDRRLRAASPRGLLKNPCGVAFDPRRKLIYVADSKAHTVEAFNYQGRHLRRVAGPGNQPAQVSFPIGLATDQQGRLYVVDSANWRVQVFNPDGTLLSILGSLGVRPGSFVRPKYVAVSREGLILVTDAAFGNFQILDLRGRVYLFVGTPGGEPGMFRVPQGIFIDGSDRIYVADSLNRRVQVFQLMTDRWYAQQGLANSPALKEP